MGNHDLAEVAAAFEMAVRLARLLEQECPVNHRVKPVDGNGPVHRLEVGAAFDADRGDRIAAASQQQRTYPPRPKTTGSHRSR